MEYYYLDASRSPKGPHSLEELSQMMLRGEVSPATEVATKGAAQWVPLGTLLTEPPLPEVPRGEGVQAAEDAPTAGPCPRCHAGVPLQEDGQLPQYCPNCRMQLRPADFGFLSCVRSAFTQCTNFKGRATRTEYWFFFLFNLCITLPLNIAYTIAEALNSGGVLSTLLEGISGLCGLVFFLPGLAITVRRLHDTNRSGKLILWCYLLMIPAIIFIFSAAVVAMGQGELNPVSAVLFLLGGALLLASFVISIYILVCMFLDSDPGANRFGPLTKERYRIAVRRPS